MSQGIKLNLNEAEVIENYLKLKSLKKTAKIYNCSTPSIQKILRKNNIKIDGKSYSTDESKRKISEFLKQRHKNKEMSGDKHPNWRGGKQKVNCSICGKELYRFPSAIKKSKVMVCNNSICLKKFHTKHGLSRTNALNRNRSEYRQWRKLVLERDNYTCQDCGKTCKSLHTHHIKEYAKYPELRHDVNNGITLCSTCHGKRHGKSNNIDLFFNIV